MSTIAPIEPILMPAICASAASELYRFSVDEYRAMVAAGIFHNKTRLHLIDGFLVKKMTQNPPHTVTDTLLSKALARSLPVDWHVRDAKPIELPDQRSMPEPDKAVVRGAERDYLKRDPGPSDIAMVAEVADSSLDEDRNRQGLIYSRAKIPVYWIVNINERQIEVYGEPGESGYKSRVTFLPGAAAPLVLDGQIVGSILVDDVLP
jgi:Uma2 family endonuclease